MFQTINTPQDSQSKVPPLVELLREEIAKALFEVEYLKASLKDVSDEHEAFSSKVVALKRLTARHEEAARASAEKRELLRSLVHDRERALLDLQHRAG